MQKQIPFLRWTASAAIGEHIRLDKFEPFFCPKLFFLAADNQDGVKK